MIDIQHFAKDQAYGSHNGTILADKVVPNSLKAPFEHAFGYLEDGNTMEGHSHPTDEIYIVCRGKGIVTVGEEQAEVVEGDVVAIPPNTYHTMTAQEHGSFLWATFWWPHID